MVACFIFAFLFQNFFIPSSSMASTLLVGDHVMADRATLAPPTRWAPFLRYRDVRRGDIIVFRKPVEEADGDHMPLVKRVIGIPGDRIHLRNGVVYLNGQAQNEPQAARPTPGSLNPYVDDFPSVPPSDQPGVTAEWAVS
ncbi:MAG TPA: signal peptidase I, partial [Acidobacteriaceae bacterium]|nr:signal peptidase I [Acidobacteriaceae bacterium]